METRPFTPATPEASNGHANAQGAHSHLHYYSQRDNDRETTRYLSAATQINLDYAKRVVDRVVHEPYRALAPAHGADVTVVARWALDSLRRIAYRDAVLATTLIAGVFFSWLFAAVVQASAWFVFATVLVMLGVAFSAIACEHWIRWYRILAGQMLRDGFDPERAPEPTTERVRLRLKAAADRKSGNLVVFREHAAFIGSGNRLGQEQIVIDASHGKENDDESSSEPIPFTNTDVHVAIAKAIGNIQLPGLNVVERVFVNGKHVRGNRGLQRQPLEPPFASVSDELLRGAADHPTADARAYVCAEIHSWQGQLVVTMFARAVHTGDGSISSTVSICFLLLTWLIRELIPCTVSLWPADSGKLRLGASSELSRTCWPRHTLWLNKALKYSHGMRVNPRKDILFVAANLLITARCAALGKRHVGAAIVITL
jgi:hypothetical protein